MSSGAVWKTLEFESDELIGDPDPPRFLPIKFPDWHAAARCAGLGTSLFYYPDYRAGSRSINANAKSICAECPIAVQRECLTTALENKDNFGVWAGTTPTIRRKMVKSRIPLEEIVDEWVTYGTYRVDVTDGGPADGPGHH